MRRRVCLSLVGVVALGCATEVVSADDDDATGGFGGHGVAGETGGFGGKPTGSGGMPAGGSGGVGATPSGGGDAQGGGPTGVGGSGVGGSGVGGNPCSIDCSAIQAPPCYEAVCNLGMYPGPLYQCVVVPIAACANADGCCPTGCTRANDSDC